MTPAYAEFSDPMQPPAYALNKYRLEKIKKMATPGAKSAKAPQKSKWVLSSILFSAQRQHAIINNKLVRKGEIVDGARLIRLTPDSARLRVKARVIDLTILDKKTKNSFKVSKGSLYEKNI